MEEFDVITVDQWEQYKSARSPEKIETTGLGPCIGIIIYNARAKMAHVGHFIDPRWDLGNVDKLLTDAMCDVNVDDLKVYVGGGEIMKDYPNECPERRAFFLELLRSRGIPDAKVKIRWIESSEETVALCIDTETGRMRYEILSDLDDTMRIVDGDA